ncbi:phytanoyl-CoA dioxygenase family protein [Pedobacter hiemivivus]|nr:phytanoyl-CoA dioxygenase family protein [Pedobacter hiemivivus]
MEYKDLSKFHTQVSGLFKWPESSEEWEQYKLNEEQVECYREHGYVSGIKFLDEAQILILRDELDAIINPQHPGSALFHQFYSNESSDPNAVLFHALGAWRVTPGFHDVLWNPAFVMAASQLLGNKAVRFWHDQLFYKPAQHGGVVAWHQDYSYWTRTIPMHHLTCWVGLDDATTENGCLYYVPDSHRWGLLDKPELAGEMDGLLGQLTEQQMAEFKPVPIELKKGYGTFHHPLLVHGSYENKSLNRRRAYVLNVFADGTLSDTDKELMPGAIPIPKGTKMRGQFHPLLFDEPLKLRL